MYMLEMARAADSPVLGRPLTIVLALTSFRAATICSPKIFVFAKFQNLTTKFFAAVLSILPLCQRSVSLVPRKSVNHVTNQSKQQTLSFSVSLRFRHWCHTWWSSDFSLQSSYFLQIVFLNFQPCLIHKQLITWVVHCYNFARGGIFIFCRITAVEIWCYVDWSKILREWCRFQLLKTAWWLLVWDFPGFSMI